MDFSIFLRFCAFFTAVRQGLAQTAPGFPIQVEKPLGVVGLNGNVITVGDLVQAIGRNRNASLITTTSD